LTKYEKWKNLDIVNIIVIPSFFFFFERYKRYKEKGFLRWNLLLLLHNNNNKNTFTLKSQLHPNYYYNLAETVSPKLNPIYPAKINTKICSQFSYLITGFDSPFDASIYIFTTLIVNTSLIVTVGNGLIYLSLSSFFFCQHTLIQNHKTFLSVPCSLMVRFRLILTKKNCESQAGFGPKKAAACAP